MYKMPNSLPRGIVMRLSKRLQNVLLQAIEKSFGNVAVYLFGSRVDERIKGGDIDLAVAVHMSKDEFRKKKIAFEKHLLYKGYALKIDLLQWNKDIDPLLFNEIKTNHVPLNV